MIPIISLSVYQVKEANKSHLHSTPVFRAAIKGSSFSFSIQIIRSRSIDILFHFN